MSATTPIDGFPNAGLSAFLGFTSFLAIFSIRTAIHTAPFASLSSDREKPNAQIENEWRKSVQETDGEKGNEQRMNGDAG